MSTKYPGNIVTSGAPAGYSVAFDGTGDYLSIADNDALDLTGDFTIECWVYLTNVSPGYNPTVVARWGASGGQIYTFQVLAGGTFRFITAAGTWTGGSVSANTWTHLAVSRSGTSLRMFTAGALSSTNTDSTSLSGTQVTSIGGENNGAQSVPGYVSNVRIVKGTALYTAAFTPPTQLFNVPNTSLLTCNSPAIIDQSPNAFAITVNGNAAVSTFTPFQGYVAYNPALGASTPGVWTISEALEARQTRRWNMYDPYFNYTTLLLHGNGTNGAQNNTFLDSSSNNFTITRNGNTTQGTFSPFSQTGWGNYFDGSGDYLTAADNAAFDLGSGDWTIELFANFDSVSGEKGLVSHFTAGSPNAGYTLRLSTSNSPSGLRLVCSGSTDVVLQAAWTPVVGTWYHIAAVRDSGTLRTYVNGVQIGSTSIAITIGNPSTTFAIGTAQTVASSDMSGYLSNVRLVKGTCLYPSGTTFTPPTAALTAVTNTSLLTCQSNRFVDNSSNAFTITANGTPSVQAFSPFYPVVAYTPQAQGGSGYFDGTGDYLGLTGGTNLAFGTGDFTVEFWVNISGNGVFYDSRPANTDGVYVTIAASDFPSAAGNSVSLVVSGSRQITGTANIKDGAWHHVAVCRSGTTTKLFVDGAQTGSSYTDTNNYLNGASRPLIASQGYTAGSAVPTGYMSGLRAIKGTALYTTTFATPTAPPTAVTNTQLLLNFTNAGIIDSTGDNVLETVGNAQISTTQSKFGGGSIAFDGTGDYLTSNPATSNLYAFGTGDFTIEFWINVNNTNTMVIFDMRPTATNGAYPTISVSSSKIIFFTNTTTVITGTTTIATGTWYHVAVSRSGTSTKLFVNGTQEGSTYTDSTNYLCPALRPFIGVNATDLANAFNGYIDDLRITKGYARYTGNFTPQTSQWQDQ